MLKVLILGQKKPAELLMKKCLEDKGLVLVGVVTPDERLSKLATCFGIKVYSVSDLEKIVRLTDICLLVNYFNFIPENILEIPKYGFLGYHPSLLPLHKGRCAIEWAVRMREPVTGGTLYWLNSECDGGDIAYQQHVFINPYLFGTAPKDSARILWVEKLSPLAIVMFCQALDDIKAGIIKRRPQEEIKFTYEPVLG